VIQYRYNACMTLGISCGDYRDNYNEPREWNSKSRWDYRMRLRPPKILVGLSVNVPNVGNPDLLGTLLVLLCTGLRTGAGAGGTGIGGGEKHFCRIVTLAAVNDEEAEEAIDLARTSSSTSSASSASLITASPSSVPAS